ncbi:MAG: Gfo/Idh/MocA family protein [Bacilli bacterium]
MKTIRIGVVGVGSIALLAHLPNYAKRSDVEVVAFADPEVDRVDRLAAAFAYDHGRSAPKVYRTLTEMLAQTEVDAVSICTPNRTHAALAMEALEHGVHVLLEKPMTVTDSDAKQLAALVERSGRVLMVGVSHRYRDDVNAVKRWLDAGELGEIYYAKTRILRRRGTPGGWFSDVAMAGGGPLMDLGVHALDLAWWLMGKPTVKEISGFLRKGIGNDHVDFVSRWRSAATGNEENEVYTTEDFASAFLRFENDLAMTMEVSWALNGEEDDALKLDIFGTKGGVSLSPLQFYSSAHGILTTAKLQVGPGNLYGREIDHFLDCVHSGQTPVSDVWQGQEVMRMLNGIVRSSAEGASVQGERG